MGHVHSAHLQGYAPPVIPQLVVLCAFAGAVSEQRQICPLAAKPSLEASPSPHPRCVVGCVVSYHLTAPTTILPVSNLASAENTVFPYYCNVLERCVWNMITAMRDWLYS